MFFVSKKIPMLLSLLLLIPFSDVAAEYHYVTQNGAGGRNGSSISNAFSLADFNNPVKWDLLANANNRKIGPGDTVYFSGIFTSTIKPAGSGTSSNYITLDGYQAGDNNLLAYTGKGAQVSGTQSIGRYGIDLSGKKYLIIQDFEVKNWGIGIVVQNSSSYNYFKRNIVHDTIDDGLLVAKSNNLIVGGKAGDGNHFYSCGSGTGAADVCSDNADYAIVSYNWLEGGPKSDRGIDGVTLNNYSNNWLIEYNCIENHNDAVLGAPSPYQSISYLQGKGEDGIDVKYQCNNVVIRGNVIRGHRNQEGISVHLGAYNIYAYGNLIANNKTGINVFENTNAPAGSTPPSRNIHIWSNLFQENVNYAITFTPSPAGKHSPLYPHHLFVYNNVFYKNVSNPISNVTSAIYWNAQNSSYLRCLNNVFYNNRPNITSKHHETYEYLTWQTFNKDTNSMNGYNTYYDPGKTSYVMWYTSSSAYTPRNIAWLDPNTKLGTNSLDKDPGMKDPSHYMFWPASSTSSMVGRGSNISNSLLPGRMYFLDNKSVWVDLSYSVGLDSSTNWNLKPPVVKFKTFTLNRWDRGAYAY